jgi:hypothetical protein
MPFKCFTLLYDSMVWPVLDYGAAIWGSREFSCVKAVQHRACRFHLGVGRYTPNQAVLGDMGWLTPEHKQWQTVTRLWCRLVNMDSDRVNKAVFTWARNVAPTRVRKNWCARVTEKANNLGLLDHFDVHEGINTASVRRALDGAFAEKTQTEWFQAVNREQAVRGNGRNKLRLYRTFKSEYQTQSYVCSVMGSRPRSALAKFRCGVAPIAIETGRYTRTPLADRTCFNCAGVVESEAHVLLHCPIYIDIRDELLQGARNIVHEFDSFQEAEQLAINLSYSELSVLTAKACKNILHRRNIFIFKD